MALAVGDHGEDQELPHGGIRQVGDRAGTGEDLEGCRLIRVGDVRQRLQRREAGLVEHELVAQAALVGRGGLGVAGQLDAEPGQDIERERQRLAHPALGAEEPDPEVVDRDLVEEIAGVHQHVVGQALERAEVGAEVGDLDLGHGQIALQLVVCGPAAVGHEGHGRAQEATRGLVGHGLPGPAAGGETDASGEETLVRVEDARGAEVEVLGELEDASLALVGGERALEQARDAEVSRGLASVGDEGVCGLLHAIVGKAVHGAGRERAAVAIHRDVASGQGLEEAHLDRGDEIGVERGGGVLAQDGEGAEVEGRADARGQLERAAAGVGQALHAVEHELDHVVGDAEGLDGGEVPAPSGQGAIEAEQLLLVQGAQELVDEEGVALGLGDEQVGELGAVVGAALEGVGEELAHVRDGERGEGDALDGDLVGAELVEGHAQGMRGIDLAVAIGADDEQVAHIGVGEHELDQAEAGDVGPLEVVEEDDQGVLGGAEDLEEALEGAIEAILGLGGAEPGDRWLGSDEEGELGDDLDQHLAARAEGRLHRLLPGGELLLGPGQELADQLSEGMGQGRVGDVAAVLIVLALDEARVCGRDRSVQLIDQRGLADARSAGDEHELPGAGARAGKGRVQRPHLLIAAVERGRDLEALGVIVLSQGKAPDLAAGLELAQALLQVVGAAASALVALLGHLGHELGDDVRDRGRDGGIEVVGRRGLAREVTVHELDGIVGGEREATGAELVEGDAEGVEVGAVVDDAVHAPGLLRGHIGQGALAAGRVPGRLACALPARAEIGDRQCPVVRPEQDVGRVDVAVNDTALVEVTQDLGDADGEHQDAVETEVLGAVELGQGGGAEVGEHEHGRALQHLHAQDLDHARDAQALEDFELAAIASPRGGCGGLALEDLEDHGPPLALALGAIHEGGRALVEQRPDPITLGIHLHTAYWAEAPEWTLRTQPLLCKRSGEMPIRF